MSSYVLRGNSSSKSDSVTFSLLSIDKHTGKVYTTGCERFPGIFRTEIMRLVCEKGSSNAFVTLKSMHMVIAILLHQTETKFMFL